MKTKKLVSVLLIIGILLTQLSVFAVALDDLQISKDLEKVVGVPDRYTVKFTIPNKKIVEDMAIEVVILMDKSSVANLSDLKDEAADLINKMAASTRPAGHENGGLEIYLAVVWFCGYAYDATDGFLKMSVPANVTTAIDAIQDHDKLSGTSFHTGLLLAQEILENGANGVADENKHLIIVSDFGGYMVVDSETPVENQINYFELLHKIGDPVVMARGLKGMVRWMNVNGTMTYRATQMYNDESTLTSATTGLGAPEVAALLDSKTLFHGVTSGKRTYNGVDYDWLEYFGPETGYYEVKYISTATGASVDSTAFPLDPAAPLHTEYPAPAGVDIPNPYEISIYACANVIREMKADGYNLYAITTPYYNPTMSQYFYIRAFQQWFSAEIGERFHLQGTLPVDPNDNTDNVNNLHSAFDGIKGRIFYELSSGTLADFINTDDFKVIKPPSADTPVKLKYGTDILVGVTTLNTAQKTVVEYIDSVKGYDFELTYEYGISYPAADSGTADKVTLKINTPVDIEKPLFLYYDVELVRNTAPGHYIVSPNHFADLNYQDSDGVPEHIILPNPEIDYLVTAPGPHRYTVTYHANGGRGTLIDPNSPYLPGATVTVLSPSGKITREGYKFLGWSTSSGGAVGYQPGNTFVINSNINLYAKWEKLDEPGDGDVTKPLPPEGEWELNLDDHYAYIIGYPDGEVKPGGNITREEATTIFFRLLTEATRAQLLSYSNRFGDVATERWSNTAISTLAGPKIVEGYPDGSFKPANKITRAEFAALAVRFDTRKIDERLTYPDTVGHWAEEAISRATYLGWVEGRPDGTFGPDDYITRAEVATFVNRMLLRLPRDEDALHEDMIKWPDNSNKQAWYYLAIQEATNSHTYNFIDDSLIHAEWKSIIENPDWLQYERRR